MPDDPRVIEKLLHFLVAKASNFFYVESGEGDSEVVSFPENGEPRQTCLKAFKTHFLVQLDVVCNRHSPLSVVVVRVVRISFAPWAYGKAVTAGFDSCTHLPENNRKANVGLSSGLTARLSEKPKEKL